jgi:hypothetical protein
MAGEGFFGFPFNFCLAPLITRKMLGRVLKIDERVNHQNRRLPRCRPQMNRKGSRQ